jgi:hypothetical protein
MSFDIDMQNYAGEIEAPVAGEANKTNSYQEKTDEQAYRPVDEALPKDEAPPAEHPQAEHFRALREEVKKIKSEQEQAIANAVKGYESELTAMRAEISRFKQPAQQHSEQEGAFLKGMVDDDVPTVGELRRAWQEHQLQIDQQQRVYIEELQLQQRHPDFNEVVENHLKPLLKEKPYLAETIRNSPNVALAAYEIGAMAKAMKQSSEPRVNVDAQKIVENSKKPGTLSSSGGQGTLSKTDYYAQMSDESFYKLMQSNLDGI